MKQLTRIMVLSLTVVGVVLLSCAKKPLDPNVEGMNPDRYKMQVSGLRAAYNTATNKIDLSWNRLDTSTISFYKVYRTSQKDSTMLRPDSVSLYALEKRDSINKNDTSFADVPELANTVYYYGVRGVSTVGDTVEGLLTLDSLVPCTVGVEVSFNIGRGAIFTATDKCSLIVNDPARIVKSVRFTQQVLKYLYKGSTGEVLYIDLDDAANPVTNSMLPALFSDKAATATIKRWIPIKGGISSALEESVSYIRMPNFEAVDTSNLNRDFAVTERDNAFYWTLKQGNGEKRVYAEISYNNGRIDTVEDNIGIKPYRILVKMRNKIGIGGTMRLNETDFIIYKPNIEYSVSIFADPTLAKDFSTWYVTSENNATIFTKDADDRYKIADKKGAWLETKPVFEELTGPGSMHDENHVYSYSLDTTTAQGRENLSALHVDTALPYTDVPADIGKYPFKLTGSEKFNEIAVPGSYWGANPVYLRGSEYVLTSIGGYSPVTNPGQNFRRIVALNKTQLIGAGTKEFSMIFIFKGKFFNDTRTVFIHREVDGTLTSRVSFDSYQPAAYTTSVGADDRLMNDDIIVAPFSFALVQTGSIQDKGKAMISEVKLVIAQFGDSPWDSTISANMTLDALYGLRHIVLPFDLKVTKASANGVRWDNIDPSDWPSGNYLMAIITKDEFGNQGFAPFSPNSTKISNPWRINVMSGK